MKSIIYIILAGCLWGIISIFVNILTDIGFTSLECVAIRTSIAALILFLYLLFTDKSKLKVQLKDIIYFVGTGIFSIVFFTYCYFEAIEVIGGAAIPALLLYTAFAGGESLSLKALILGLGSGFGYALYSIFGKLVVDKYDAVTITFYTFAVATIGAVPISGFTKDIGMLFSLKGIFAAIGLGFFSTALAFLLYTKGLRGIEAGKASILATVEPFVAAIVGVFLFNEEFNIPKVTGMLLILFAICYLNFSKKEKEAN